MIGHAIGKYPLLFIIGTFTFLLPLLSYFLIYPIHIETDVRRGFAHRNGRSTHEFKAFGEFYNVSVKGMELLVILIESKDEGYSRLTMSAELLNEMERLDNYISTRWVPTITGRNLTFKELESTRGSINFLFHAFKFGYEWQQGNLNNNWTLDDSINLDYPTSTIFGHHVSIGSHFFGVERYGEKRPEGKASNIKSIRSAVLWYMLGAEGVEQRKYLRELEIKIFEESRNKDFSDQFTFYVYGDEVINNEMLIGSVRTTKLLIVGLCIMLVFMGVALRDFSLKQAIILTITSVLSPMLAMAGTFALLAWIGVRFNSIMSISPFLVLGIGVDDAFLLIHSWRKHSRLNTNSVKIMESVVKEAGPSISITSVTNVLAFSVGILSPASQMSSFCLCTTIAVALDYVFEFTFFAPSLALCTPQPTMSVKKIREDRKDNFWSNYASFLLSTWGRILCLFIFGLLVIFSFFGIANMEADFDPQKTFPSDSHLQKALKPINQLYIEYKPLSFIVHRPPNISNTTELFDFMEMVGRIEALPGGTSNSTQLWLRDYLDYDSKLRTNNETNEYTPSYENAPRFLTDRLMEDKNIVFYHRDGAKVIIDKFVFVVVFTGEKNWHQRAFFIEEIRTLIDEYPQFNVTVFDYDATIFDLIITVKSEMLKAVLVTLACMTIVCFVFIPNIKYTAIATLNVFSISYNLLGGLGWWGNSLDPVTLINVLMSIGFSVDFTAHMCYHYWSVEHNERLLGIQTDASDHQRLVSSLSSVGRPMIEAALSTIICMFPLFFVNIYVVISFAKTVLCIGIFGIIHGLFILPVMLSMPFSCGRRKHSNYNRQESGAPLMPILS